MSKIEGEGGRVKERGMEKEIERVRQSKRDNWDRKRERERRTY